MNVIKSAIAISPDQPFLVDEVKLDNPREEEVLVRITGVGICHSDISAKEQHLPVPLPAVLGHEGAGVVEKVGSKVEGISPGDHVVLSFLSCGSCTSCAGGHPSYCVSFLPSNFMCSRDDGTKAINHKGQYIGSNFFGQSSFGTYAIAHQRNTIKVRNDAPLELLGPLGCGFQTGAGSIMEAMNCRGDSALLVTGGGAVGLGAVMGGVIQGCSTIIVVEPHESRRKLALELGATHVMDPFAEESIAESVRKIVPDGVNYAFDTSARQDVIDGIVQSMAASGTIGLVGVPTSDKPTVSLDVLTMLALGLKVMGITEGDVDPVIFIPKLVDLFMEGKFPFDKLCSTYPLDEINIAIEDLKSGRTVKAVLCP